MNAIPCLTIEDVASLDGVLAEFLKKAEAELTVVIDRGGNVIRLEFGHCKVLDQKLAYAIDRNSIVPDRNGKADADISRSE